MVVPKASGLAQPYGSESAPNVLASKFLRDRRKALGGLPKQQHQGSYIFAWRS
jgi:hypothetical protein